MIPKLPDYSMRLLNPPADEDSEDSEDDEDEGELINNASIHSRDTDTNEDEKADS